MRYHSKVLIELIRDNSIRRMAEIGVARAQNLWAIVDSIAGNVIEECWGIDPWIPKEVLGKKEMMTGHDLYMFVCNLMPKYKQLRFLRMTSEEAAPLFPDSYFDFVYIDGDHSYDAVCKDIELWLPKVRWGGLLGGHDYNMGRVQRAVNDSLKGVYTPENKFKDLKIWMYEVV